MKISLTMYDALVAANVPTDKAKAVVDAWENDVDKLATRSDLQQVETRLSASIYELRSEVHSEMRVLRSEVHSEMKVMRWQLGAIFICVVVPLLKMGFDLLSRS